MKAHGGGFVKRHEAALAELGLSDDETVGAEIFRSQSAGFRDAQSRAPEEPEEGAIGRGAQRAWGAKARRRLQEAPDVGWAEQVGDAPVRVMTEREGRRELVTGVLGSGVTCEMRHDAQPSTALARRRGEAGPVDCGRCPDVHLSPRSGELGETSENAFLTIQTKSGSSPDREVGLDSLDQHEVTSGHGWATIRRSATSTLA